MLLNVNYFIVRIPIVNDSLESKIGIEKTQFTSDIIDQSLGCDYCACSWIFFSVKVLDCDDSAFPLDDNGSLYCKWE